MSQVLGTRAAVLCAIATAAIAAGSAHGASGALGINLDANYDWSTQAIWTDVTKTLRAWGMPSQPWIANPSLTYTADGYPLQAASAISYLNQYPDGVYKLSYEGSATVTARWMGAISNVVRVGNTTTADVTITHGRGTLLGLEVSNVDTADPIRNLSLMMPGTAPGQVFTDAFTHRLVPFDTLRFMDWGRTNFNTVKEWSQRTTPTTSIQSGENGVALESMISLANQVDKNAWFNVPAGATDDYVRNMAKLIHSQLEPGRMVYVEYSNELWNSVFSQYGQVLADGRANPALTASSADDFGRVGQQDAFRTKQIGDIFRAEFGADAPRVKIVLAGQAANPYFLSAGLSFLKNTYGAANIGIDAVAIAPYLNIKASDDVAGLTLDGLFAALNREMDTTVTGWIKATSTLARQYGLPMLAYEGGQHLLPYEVGTGVLLNQDVKKQANHDKRMGDLLVRLLDIWGQNGGGLFDHFSFTSADSNSGYWGLLQGIHDGGSEKWDALLRATLPMGDADLSGTLDGNDLAILMTHYGQAGMWWEQGDFNGDGRVNADDLALFDQGLMNVGQFRVGLSIVPEPGVGVLAAAGAGGAVGLMRRRRPRGRPACGFAGGR